MSSWKDRKFFKDRASKISDLFRIPKIENSLKELVCAGIQVAGGVALTVYTFDNPAYRILPFMYSAIAIGGTYNIFKIMRKNFQSSVYIETKTVTSAWELANGIFTYSASIYTFSNGLKHNDKIWIPCLAIAAFGYYFAASAIDDLVTVCNRKQYLKLMFEPTLIACTSTFLLYFQNHEESCLYWLPFVLIGAAGFKIASEGFSKADSAEETKLLLHKVLTTLMGGGLLTFSGIVLTVYGSIHNFPFLWTVFMIIVIFFGAFIIFGSLTCLRRYIDLDEEIFLSLVGMVAGPLTFLSASLTINYVEDTTMTYFLFLFLAGLGHFILCRSVYKFYKMTPGPELRRYYQRVLGPVMTVYSSLATAYIGYRMGSRFYLLTMPFIPAGIYATYRGFRRKRQ